MGYNSTCCSSLLLTKKDTGTSTPVTERGLHDPRPGVTPHPFLCFCLICLHPREVQIFLILNFPDQVSALEFLPSARRLRHFALTHGRPLTPRPSCTHVWFLVTRSHTRETVYVLLSHLTPCLPHQRALYISLDSLLVTAGPGVAPLSNGRSTQRRRKAEFY